ncbi:tryptophan synthase beta type 2 [Striga asiatica]|uniref:Tryptophan synthase beta type 2 n=1 Tax=Striga asiatica TaxID=4170 RepID=A0A5A7QKU1_STRAF|nr:tryptophan synthase beta type 2 [Striga asiatica]
MTRRGKDGSSGIGLACCSRMSKVQRRSVVVGGWPRVAARLRGEVAEEDVGDDRGKKELHLPKPSRQSSLPSPAKSSSSPALQGWEIPVRPSLPTAPLNSPSVGHSSPAPSLSVWIAIPVTPAPFVYDVILFEPYPNQKLNLWYQRIGPKKPNSTRNSNVGLNRAFRPELRVDDEELRLHIDNLTGGGESVLVELEVKKLFPTFDIGVTGGGRNTGGMIVKVEIYNLEGSYMEVAATATQGSVEEAAAGSEGRDDGDGVGAAAEIGMRKMQSSKTAAAEEFCGGGGGGRRRRKAGVSRNCIGKRQKIAAAMRNGRGFA